MRGRTVKAFYRVHIWLGVASGMALLLLCISGTLTVFRAEIAQWTGGPLSHEQRACALAPDAAMALMQAPAATAGAAPLRRLSLPAMTGGFYELRLADGSRSAVDLCGVAVGTLHAEAADYLVNLHTRLFWGKTGRWIIGGIGVLMLVSAISGVLVHRKLFSQLFTLRRGRGPRLWLSDAHKLVGVWLLPFHLLVAATGAWLGLYTLLVSDPPALGNAMRQAPYTEPAPVGPMLLQAQAALPGLVPVFVDFFPKRGQVSVRGNLPEHLVQRYRAEVLFDGRDGRLLAIHDPRSATGLAWLKGAMMPLHVGDWSGYGVRWAYFLFGIGTSVLVWLGLHLWADRRLRTSGRVWPRGSLADQVIKTSWIAMLTACVLPLLLAATVRSTQVLDGTTFGLAMAGIWGTLLLWTRRRRYRRMAAA